VIQLVNFHLSWFTKKGPHKSPKNSVFPVFYKQNLGLVGPFSGDQPKWKISHFRHSIEPRTMSRRLGLPSSAT